MPAVESSPTSLQTSVKSSRILIVEDDTDLNNLLKFTFENSKDPFVCEALFEGSRVQSVASQFNPHLILLDIMLPGLTGLEVLKKLKQDNKTANIPVILLTAKSLENDRVEGFELGADDYVTKPFSPKELLLRVAAKIRRANHPLATTAVSESYISKSTSTEGGTPVIKLRDIEIHPEDFKVFLDQKPLTLTVTEFQLLLYLCERPGKIHSRDSLLQKVWGYEGKINSRTVDTHVKRLRQKMGEFGNCIETVHGFGYQIQ